MDAANASLMKLLFLTKCVIFFYIFSLLYYVSFVNITLYLMDAANASLMKLLFLTKCVFEEVRTAILFFQSVIFFYIFDMRWIE